MTVTRLFQAFVHYEGGSAPLEFYSDLSQSTEVIKTAFVVASLMVGDAMIVNILLKASFNCTDVFYIDLSPMDSLGLQQCRDRVSYLHFCGSRRLVSLSSQFQTILMRTLVSGIGITYQLTQYIPGQNVFLTKAARWITSLCVLTLWYSVQVSAFIDHN